MSNQPLDRGRICVSVDRFAKKENGQNVVDQAGNQVFKNKFMQIGEATKWQRDNGSIQVQQKIYLRLLTNEVHEQLIFWDSEKNQTNVSQAQQNQQANFAQNQQGYQR